MNDNILVFLDDRYMHLDFIKNYIENIKINKNINATFIAINKEWLLENCESWKKNHISQTILQSRIYKDKIKDKTNPENIYSDYNAINHCKIDFIKYAIDNKLVDQNEFICWCDFGYYNSIYCNQPMEYPYAKLDLNKFNVEKVNMCLRNKIDPIDFNMDYTLICAPEKFTGSFFGASNENMIKLYHLYHYCLDEMYENFISDDDQHVYLRCFYKIPDLFNLFLSEQTWPRALNYFQKNFTNRYELIKYYTKDINNGIFVEIGVCNGDLSNFILENNLTCKLYGIDPYIAYNEYDDACNNFVGNELYVNTLSKLKSKYNDRIEFIRCFSNDASRIIHDNLDFVYIDGNHKYKYVLEDLETWYKKIKNGGFIICDDAVDIDETNRNEEGDVHIEWCPGSYGKYGVVHACKTFSEKYNIPFFKFDTQIIIFKPLYS